MKEILGKTPTGCEHLKGATLGFDGLFIKNVNFIAWRYRKEVNFTMRALTMAELSIELCLDLVLKHHWKIIPADQNHSKCSMNRKKNNKSFHCTKFPCFSLPKIFHAVLFPSIVFFSLLFILLFPLYYSVSVLS